MSFLRGAVQRVGRFLFPIFQYDFLEVFMAFFNFEVEVLQTFVVALCAGLDVWGVVNLLEGYGNDNPGAKS